MALSEILAWLGVFTLVIVVGKILAEDEEGVIEKLRNLSVEEMMAMQRMIVSAIGFLILSVSLYSIGM
jgi:hypothetical protein